MEEEKTNSAENEIKEVDGTEEVHENKEASTGKHAI